jgi:hypothetical protein
MNFRNNEIKLDDLDNLIISIIRRNNGITAVLLHCTIKTDFNRDINPAIILSRIDRLIAFGIIYNIVETVGKYVSSQIHHKFDFKSSERHQ